jgi:hypothetical protein
LSPLIKGGRGVVRGIKGEGGLLNEANMFYSVGQRFAPMCTSTDYSWAKVECYRFARKERVITNHNNKEEENEMSY